MHSEYDTRGACLLGHGNIVILRRADVLGPSPLFTRTWYYCYLKESRCTRTESPVYKDMVILLSYGEPMY